MERIKLSKLQQLERDADRAIEAAAKSARETQRLAKAASKSATDLEQEASKVADNVREISRAAEELSILTIAATAQKK
jgi:methyl-accepting chemotaxis protein